jgi:hypothetical protein
MQSRDAHSLEALEKVNRLLQLGSVLNGRGGWRQLEKKKKIYAGSDEPLPTLIKEG